MTDSDIDAAKIAAMKAAELGRSMYILIMFAYEMCIDIYFSFLSHFYRELCLNDECGIILFPSLAFHY